VQMLYCVGCLRTLSVCDIFKTVTLADMRTPAFPVLLIFIFSQLIFALNL